MLVTQLMFTLMITPTVTLKLTLTLTHVRFVMRTMLFLHLISHSSMSVIMSSSTTVPIFPGYERDRVGYSKVDQGYYHQGETQGTPMTQTHFREKVSLT